MGSLAESLPRPTLATARQRVRQGARSLFRAAVDLIFPPVCVACQNGLAVQGDCIVICVRCRRAFIDGRPSCAFCGAGIHETGDPARRCPHCRQDRFRFGAVVRLGDYEGPLHHAILTAKNCAGSALAVHLGRLLVAERRAELHALQCDAIVAVPAHWTRQSKHGYNSAEAIGQQVANCLGLPFADRLVTRLRATRPQAELSPRERRANVKAAFAVRKHPDLSKAKILLVDDVMTTGATADEISKALLAAGAHSVSIAVLARAVGDH